MLEEAFDHTESNAVDSHPSVQSSRLQEEQPLNLSQCFDVFSRNEALEDHFCSKCSRQPDGDIALRKMVSAAAVGAVAVAVAATMTCVVDSRRWLTFAVLCPFLLCRNADKEDGFVPDAANPRHSTKTVSVQPVFSAQIEQLGDLSHPGACLCLFVPACLRVAHMMSAVFCVGSAARVWTSGRSYPARANHKARLTCQRGCFWVASWQTAAAPLALRALALAR